MVLLLRKLYLYLTKDPEAVHYFLGRGGGVQLFPGGVQIANFYRNPYRYLLLSRGSVRTPSGSAHGQFYHNGTIFITVRPLTIIVRH